ncbi:TonB-dependent receptor, partial [Sphingomonas sp. ABOLE]
MRIGLATALLASAAWAAPVWAQSTEQPAQPEAKQQDSGIAEIVVTAQKRAENVQDVPIAISAFGADTLKERAVGSVAQLSSISPNFPLYSLTPFSFSPSVLSAFILFFLSVYFSFPFSSCFP